MTKCMRGGVLVVVAGISVYTPGYMGIVGYPTVDIPQSRNLNRTFNPLPDLPNASPIHPEIMYI